MRLMIQSYAEYTRPETLRVSVGTWNVNGGKHFRSIAFKHEHITDWLLDLPKIIRSTRPGTEITFIAFLGFMTFDCWSRQSVFKVFFYNSFPGQMSQETPKPSFNFVRFSLRVNV